MIYDLRSHPRGFSGFGALDVDWTARIGTLTLRITRADWRGLLNEFLTVAAETSGVALNIEDVIAGLSAMSFAGFLQLLGLDSVPAAVTSIIEGTVWSSVQSWAAGQWNPRERFYRQATAALGGDPRRAGSGFVGFYLGTNRAAWDEEKAQRAAMGWPAPAYELAEVFGDGLAYYGLVYRVADLPPGPDGVPQAISAGGGVLFVGADGQTYRGCLSAGGSGQVVVVGAGSVCPPNFGGCPSKGCTFAASSGGGGGGQVGKSTKTPTGAVDPTNAAQRAFAVKLLQRLLVPFGYAGGETGIYDAATEVAFQAWAAVQKPPTTVPAFLSAPASGPVWVAAKTLVKAARDLAVADGLEDDVGDLQDKTEGWSTGTKVGIVIAGVIVGGTVGYLLLRRRG